MNKLIIKIILLTKTPNKYIYIYIYIFMKHIIIVAEEYWFDRNYPRESLKGAEYLIKTLENNNKKYKYNILDHPNKFKKTIDEIKPENIKAIFLFHDIITDSYLNNMTIEEINNYLFDLQNKNNIYIYPGIKKTEYFGSKKYYYDLVNDDKYKYIILPKSKVVKIKNYQGFKSEGFIMKQLWKNTQELFSIFDKVVIKKGYSYSGHQVITVTKEKIQSFNKFKKKLKRLNYKYHWNQTIINSALMEKNVDRYYILQGFNEIVRKNEFRVFFYNGKAIYIHVNPMRSDNFCIDDVEVKENINNNLVVEILRFSKEVYKDIIPLFWKEEKNPILFRIDISYATDKEFQDSFSINVKGFDNKIRLYVNEAEIDPTNFFFNELICKKDKNITNKYVQELFGSLINNYINDL